MRVTNSPEEKHHLCSDDRSEKTRIIHQIRELMRQLENAPCMPRPAGPPNLRFLEKKQPRYFEDPDSVPTITHVPLLEIRPTSEYKKMMKNKEQCQNVVYIDVPPAESTHASPPWALPSAGSVVPKAAEPLPCPKKDCVCCPQANQFRLFREE